MDQFSEEREEYLDQHFVRFKVWDSSLVDQHTFKDRWFYTLEEIYSQVGPEKPTQKVDLKCQSGIVKRGNLLYIWEQSLKISVSRSDRRTFILLAWFSAKLNISKYNFPNRSFVLFIRQAISLLLSSRLQLARKM